MLDLLLVDDEKSVLEAMANTIRWENYGVRLVGTCGNAIEALHFMETSHLDVIITDVKMPVDDGRGRGAEHKVEYARGDVR